MLVLSKESAVAISYEFGGKFSTREPWTHPRRVIDTYEVMYVLDGAVFLEEDGQQYRLENGDVCILRPGYEYGGWQQSTGKTSFYWIHFKANNFSGLKIQPGILKESEHYGFSVLFRQLLHIGNAPEYPPYAVNASLALLLAELHTAQKSRDNSGASLVYEVAEWIRINSMHKLSVKNTAQHFGYHPDYLCKIMRENLGIQLKQYINSERIKMAKNLLLTTKMPIKQLADMMGWDNENQFIHYFQYHEKIGPAKFRNLYYRTHLNNQ